MPTKKDSTKATFKHIDQVFANLSFFSTELLTRGHMHDRSKLLPPEKEGFDQNTCQLKTMVYGSPEYKASRERMKPTLDHHYANNDHHPEHYKKVDEMNLPAVLTIEHPKTRIAETVVSTSQAKNAKILSMDSMQSITAQDVKAGANYLSIMESNLAMLKEALN